MEQREKTEHMEQRRHLEVELTTARDTLDEKKEQGEDDWVVGKHSGDVTTKCAFIGPILSADLDELSATPL